MNGWTPKEIWAGIRRARLVQVLVVYVGASFVVLQVVELFIEQLGLPDWFFPGAVALLLIGLPIILATAIVQSAPSASPEGPQATGLDSASMIPELAEPAPDRAVTATQVATVAKHWLTWRKAIMGGVLAFAAWGVFVTAYMTMRVLGIGPVGSLVAAGVIDPSDRIIVAEFESAPADSLLAIGAAEAFRVDLAQSPLVRIAHPSYVGGVLARMERAPGTRLDLELAREVAIREGLKAVIGGAINAVGAGYVLSARLVSAEDGEELAVFRETAEDSTEILQAIDRLSADLREKLGESLKSIRAEVPLQRVTTASLEALRKYSQAVQAVDVEGEDEKAIALLEEAIAIDTAFAMAYRKLGAVLSNNLIFRARTKEVLTKAYEHRDRLTDRERYMTLGTYYSFVTNETQKGITAYESLLDIYPNDDWALNNLSLLYMDVRDPERAEDLLLRAIELDSTSASAYINVTFTQVALGKVDAAQATLDRFARNVPGHPAGQFFSAQLEGFRGDYAAAENRIQELREAHRGSVFVRTQTSWWLSNLARIRGKVAEANRYERDRMTTSESAELTSTYLFAAGSVAWTDAIVKRRPEPGLRVLEEALERHPLSSIDPLDRPYPFLANVLAAAGRPESARRLINELEAEVDPELRRDSEPWRHFALGEIALAEDRPEDALSEYHEFHRSAPFDICGECGLVHIARAHDAAGQADSAIAYFERYLETPFLNRTAWDSFWLAHSYERLGGLYEAEGDGEKAVYNYGQLVKLWEEADPELQPRVEAARRAIAVLSADR